MKYDYSIGKILYKVHIMDSCFYCMKNAKLDSLMMKICELPYSIIYLNRDQKHIGRVIVALKVHATEYFQLTPEQNAGFFAEVSMAALAIQHLYQPNKINYATFGDLVPHVHVHLVPKYKDGLQWGEVFRDDVPKVLLTDEQYQKIIQQISSELKSMIK